MIYAWDSLWFLIASVLEYAAPPSMRRPLVLLSTYIALELVFHAPAEAGVAWLLQIWRANLG